MADDRTAPRFTLDADTPRRTSSGRRAAPPKAPKDPPRSARADEQDVRRALKSLESVYSMVAAGLIVLRTPDAAAEWARRSEGLAESNRAALEASPRLARMIANSGSAGGGVTLVTTHLIAIAPVVVIARGELAARADAEAAGEDPDAPRETFADRIRRQRQQAQQAQPDQPSTPPVPIRRHAATGTDDLRADPTFIPGL